MSEQPTLMTVIVFRSKLSFDELQKRYRARMDAFRQVPGLLQKYYLFDEKTKDISGVYLWQNKESLEHYLDSELRKSISAAYDIEGPPHVQTFEILDVLQRSSFTAKVE